MLATAINGIIMSHVEILTVNTPSLQLLRLQTS